MQLLKHYLEMVVAMIVGMAVLSFPLDWALDSVGAESDTLMFLEMATAMTVPMIGWMVYRGHGWRVCAEMAAAMYVPTFAAITVLSAGWMTDVDALMAIEHVAMLLAMLGAMLLRPAEYTHHHAAVSA